MAGHHGGGDGRADRTCSAGQNRGGSRDDTNRLCRTGAAGAPFPTLQRIIVDGEARAGQIALRSLVARRHNEGALAQRLEAVRPDPADVSTMLLSGGTTSMSKLIPRTHDDYVLNARLCAQAG